MSRRSTPRPLMPELCAQGTRSTVDTLGSCVLVGRTLSVPVCTRRRGLAQPRTRSLARSSHSGNAPLRRGTRRVRPTSTHEPRASTVERVPWAQSSGINGRGVDLRDITCADQAPSYGIDRWSTHDAFDSATPSAPTTNSLYWISIPWRGSFNTGAERETSHNAVDLSIDVGHGSSGPAFVHVLGESGDGLVV
ncbi:hypothetical protein HPB52_021314 [Rhipicephalus sanguineus]|uniref:Uncharacterized protein n=1 Tax=Rhipicephalus sanguineus TaxID=34632 RepID=A0A9D4SN88_RHISA|nr:hypothetical protein HPB52_021314 [Rhipicephalus sanguineus]